MLKLGLSLIFVYYVCTTSINNNNYNWKKKLNISIKNLLHFIGKCIIDFQINITSNGKIFR